MARKTRRELRRFAIYLPPIYFSGMKKWRAVEVRHHAPARTVEEQMAETQREHAQRKEALARRR
jgi:hypothetical protein